jgi:beta-lactamase class A
MADKESKKHPLRAHLYIIIPTLIVGTVFGWVLKTYGNSESDAQSCLRLSGYQYIQPLIACNSGGSGSTSKSLTNLTKALQNTIDDAKMRGAITTASVYMRDLTTSQETSINTSEQFYPASLKKVPLLMAYYKEATSNPGILDQNITVTDPVDYNQGTTIVPKEVPKYGQTYTVRQLITFMIVYSDNSSFQILLKNLGDDRFTQAYNDLKLHYQSDVGTINDSMTAFQFSLFFRTLFNASYLEHNYSEEVLGLLTTVDYKNGLVAGVPSEIKVAHKFGIGVVNSTAGSQHGELHDCGIIYLPNNPYLLCIMTKSQALDLSVVEKTIGDISRVTYSYASNSFKKP